MRRDSSGGHHAEKADQGPQPEGLGRRSPQQNYQRKRCKLTYFIQYYLHINFMVGNVVFHLLDLVQKTENQMKLFNGFQNISMKVVAVLFLLLKTGLKMNACDV